MYFTIFPKTNHLHHFIKIKWVKSILNISNNLVNASQYDQQIKSNCYANIH